MRFLENELPVGSVLGFNSLLKQLSPNASEVTEEHLQKVMENGWLFMLYDDDIKKVVGISTLTRVYKPTAFFGTLEDVVVDLEHRGEGLGIVLVRAVIFKAKEVGMKFIDLTSNPARIEANGLYVRLGAKKRETNIYRFNI